MVYDADWVISQAEEMSRPKVRELIAWLQARVPATCEFIYRPRYVETHFTLTRAEIEVDLDRNG